MVQSEKLRWYEMDPVSYTHLDVYKRQVLQQVLLQQERFRLQVRLQCLRQDVHLSRFVTLSDIRS